MRDTGHQGRPIFSTAPHSHTAMEAGDREVPEELRCSSMTLGEEVPAGSMARGVVRVGLDREGLGPCYLR